MGGNWFWVRDAVTVADPEEIARAAIWYTWVHENVQSVRTALWHTDSKLGLNLLVPMLNPVKEPQYLGELSQLAGRIGVLLQQIERRLTALTVEVRDHAQYLGMAALIYASAEADAATHIALCKSLNALGCVANVSGFTGATLLDSLPGYVTQMLGVDPSRKEKGPYVDVKLAPSGGIEAQHQIASIASGSEIKGVPGSGVSVVSARLARLWETVGFPPWAGASGAVVVGASGALWGGINDRKFGSKVLRVDVDGTYSQKRGRSLWGKPTRAPKSWDVPNHPVANALGAAKASQTLTNRGFSRSQKRGTRTPKTASQLLKRVESAPNSGNAGQVQILKHRDLKTKRNSWSVIVRGTQKWLPGTTNPQDMTSNFAEIAGQISDQHVSVRLAMELAGISPGEAVEFVGHSQGGTVALSLAADLELRSEYNVVSVLTAGAPVGPKVPTGTPVLALENLADIVPALDGKPGSTGLEHQVVHFDASGLHVAKKVGAHSVGTYVEAAEQLGNESVFDRRLEGFADWERKRIHSLGLGATTSTEVLYFSASRVRGNIESERIVPNGLPGKCGTGTARLGSVASVG